MGGGKFEVTLHYLTLYPRRLTHIISQGIAYSPLSKVGFGAFLKGISTMDGGREGICQVGVRTYKPPD